MSATKNEKLTRNVFVKDFAAAALTAGLLGGAATPAHAEELGDISSEPEETPQTQVEETQVEPTLEEQVEQAYEQVETAQAEVVTAQESYDEAAANLAEAEQSATDTQIALDEAQAAADEAETEHEAAEQAVSDAETVIEEKEEELVSAQEQVAAGEQEVQDTEAAVEAANSELSDEQRAEYDAAKQALDEATANESEKQSDADEARDKLRDAKAAHDTAKAELDEATTAWQSARDEYSAAESDYRTAKRELKAAQDNLAAVEAGSTDSAEVVRAREQVSACEKTVKECQDAKDAAQRQYNVYATALENVQANYNRAKADFDNAKAVKDTADTKVSAAQSEVNAAQQALNDVEAQRAEQIAARKAAQAALDQAKKDEATAKANKTAADNEVNKAKTQLEQAKAELANASTGDQAAIARGALGFYEWMGDSDAAAVFSEQTKSKATGEIVQNFTNMGAEDDATGLENMRRALELIAEGNRLRTTDNNFTGLSDLRVSSWLMAVAQVNCNWETQDYQHAKSYNVGENLHCTTSDPYIGWYTDEKAAYDANSSTTGAGHYKNIVNNSYEVTGMAATQSERGWYPGMYEPYTYTQTFKWEESAHKSYSYSEYYNKFMQYYNRVMPGDTTALETAVQAAQNKLDQAQASAASMNTRYNNAKATVSQRERELTNATVTADTSTANAALTQAKQKLSSAQSEQRQAASVLSEKQGLYNELSQSLTKATSDRNARAEELESAKSDLSNATTKLGAAQQVLDEAMANINADAVQAVRDAQSKFDAAEATYQQKSDAIVDAGKDYRNKDAEFARKTRILESAERKLERAEEALAQAKDVYATAVQNFNVVSSLYDKLNQAIQARGAAADHLAQLVGSLENAQTALEEARASHEAAKTNAATKLDAYNAACDAVDALVAQLGEKNNLVAAAKATRNAASEVLEAARQKLQSAWNVYQPLKDALDRLTQAQQELDEAKARVAQQAHADEQARYDEAKNFARDVAHEAAVVSNQHAITESVAALVTGSAETGNIESTHNAGLDVHKLYIDHSLETRGVGLNESVLAAIDEASEMDDATVDTIGGNAVLVFGTLAGVTAATIFVASKKRKEQAEA